MPFQAGQLEPAFASLAEAVASGKTGMAALAVGDARGTLRKAVFAPVGARSYDADSLFFLASVTKPIFATTVMQLVEDGLLELHEPLAGQLPEFRRPPRDRISTWHLLTHTSGLEDVAPELIRRTRPSARRLTELSLNAPLAFEPGTRWAYTSSSYFVLAELARRLTGYASARRLLEDRLLEPLGMADTGYDPRRRGRAIVPVAGVGADNRFIRYMLLRYLVSIAHPGGGLWGTLDDVVRFGAAWLAPRRGATVGGEGTIDRWLPLAPDTLRLMGEDQTRGMAGLYNGEERPVHHGLAWSKPTLMRDVPGGPDVIDHGGATGTRLWIDPGAGLVFVYFTAEWNPARDVERDTLWSVYESLGLARSRVTA